MVGVFKRSLSFPNKNPTPKPPKISRHIRSISLPCRSHPLISHLTHEITQLRAWSTQQQPCKPATLSWLCDGLTRLKDVHDTLDEILQLPQSLDSLRRRPFWVENLLDDFLRFVDTYGIFHTSALALKEDQLSAQVAVRMRNDAGLTSFVKSCDKLAKEMAGLAYVVQQGSSTRSSSKSSIPTWDNPAMSAADSELTLIVGDVIEVTVSVSVALFGGLSTLFSPRRPSRYSWAVLLWLFGVKPDGDGQGIDEFRRVGVLKKKGNEEVKMVLGRLRWRSVLVAWKIRAVMYSGV